ncbi:GNAT family N-acetyltransferase [Georgenia sp. SUBG003]|uniref:GNAT family N-acetyltransferase n=1 Tax=Georgenia sp. SUBG003 TaxID=1497974 RepID=UPI003AB3659B
MATTCTPQPSTAAAAARTAATSSSSCSGGTGAQVQQQPVALDPADDGGRAAAQRGRERHGEGERDPRDRDAVRAHNKAFGDQWGSQPHTPETWAEGRTHHVPSWSFVALDRSSDRAQVAGYLMSSRYDQDWPALGWSEGYTEILGVLPDWRGKHVATALLTRAMRAYADDGMQ